MNSVFRLHITLLLLASLLLTTATGCIPSSVKKPKLVLWEHPLVGKIWDVKQQAFVDQATLVDRLLASGYILLGERHDNLVHHQHQAWFIETLSKQKRQASVAFEMIDNYQGARLAKQQIKSADQLIDVLNRSKSNWQYELRYKQLFAAALDAGFRIDAANLNSKRLMHTAKQGEDKLPEVYQQMLAKTPFSDQQYNALQLEINQAHCNMLPEKSSRSMALGQRLRDAIMAHSLLKSKADYKVLIAGMGHVRNDHAVPVYLQTNLKSKADDGKILSVGFIEVDNDLKNAQDYTRYSGYQSLPFDIVWFTPKLERVDACEELRKHFKDKK